MRILVNTRLLIKNKLEGIGWFTHETFKRIVQKQAGTEFIFLFDRPHGPGFEFAPNVKAIHAGPPSRHPLLWYAWFQYTVPRIIETYKPAIFVSPDGYLSLRTNIPQLPVIHDLNFVHRPMDLPFLTRAYYNRYFPAFAREAKRILTVSEYSKKDIVSSFGILPGKIDVAYNGANEIYQPASDGDKYQTRLKLTRGAPYFLFVGSLHPRKNVAMLLKAFDAFRRNYSAPFKLVIVGEKMFKTEDIKSAFQNMRYQEDVIFTGRQTPGELQKTYSAATALTFIPLFEGFGIPIVEAMYCDVPVLISNATSLPEVAGEAALKVNPFSVDSIRDGMLKMANEANFRNTLIAKARVQRKKFTWDKTAEKTWESIQKCLHA